MNIPNDTQRLEIYKAALQLYKEEIAKGNCTLTGFCYLIFWTCQQKKFHDITILDLDPMLQEFPELYIYKPNFSVTIGGKEGGSYWFDTLPNKGVLKRIEILETIIYNMETNHDKNLV